MKRLEKPKYKVLKTLEPTGRSAAALTTSHAGQQSSIGLGMHQCTTRHRIHELPGRVHAQQILPANLAMSHVGRCGRQTVATA